MNVRGRSVGRPDREASANTASLCLLAALFLVVVGCAPDHPEVVVVNEVHEDVQVRAISFNGCKWDTVLAFGEATAPQFCLPGDDRVHFQKLVAADSLTSTADEPDHAALWFNYQTISLQRADDGGFHRLVLTPDDLEQDFSVPGPYGH